MSALDRQIKSNIQRGQYGYIGSGSSRRVYDMNNGYVLKTAKNKAGNAQNMAEYIISVNDDFNIFAKVIYAFDDYNYVIMEKAKKLNNVNYLWRYFDVSDKDEFKRLPLMNIISKRYNLIINDLAKISSWGIINRQLKIIDYGFTIEVKEKYY